MKILLLFILMIPLAQAQMYDDVIGHFRFNAKSAAIVVPGEPTTIEVWFTDKKTQEVIKDYKEMHGKIMHMVLIKKDLSVFKHIHPYFDPITGIFQITLNLPLSDPDNFHTQEALMESGMYMLMADVEPRGYGMRMSHTMVHAHGSHNMQPLTLDPIQNDIVQKEFTQYGQNYLLEMQYETTTGCNGSLVEFTTTLYTQEKAGTYQPAKDIQPWLGAGAHSVWVSQGMMSHQTMKMHYAHMHSRIPESGSSHFFNFHDLKIMKPGIQKIWFQIKHKDKVLTIPVVFDYKLNTQPGSCK